MKYGWPCTATCYSRREREKKNKELFARVCWQPNSRLHSPMWEHRLQQRTRRRKPNIVATSYQISKWGDKWWAGLPCGWPIHPGNGLKFHRLKSPVPGSSRTLFCVLANVSGAELAASYTLSLGPCRHLKGLTLLGQHFLLVHWHARNLG